MCVFKESIKSIPVAVGGSGYAVAPTVQISAPPVATVLTPTPRQATATAVLTGDAVTSILITDAGVVDWGFKATIHGILEEPSEEEIATYMKNREDRKKCMKYINVVCWVLNVLMISEDPEIQQKLYSAKTGIISLTKLLILTLFTLIIYNSTIASEIFDNIRMRRTKSYKSC